MIYVANRSPNLCASAVKKAWKRERQLVIQGKGTRDWTEDQQRQLLRDGIVKDENGYPYHGHHMKSVEAYPAYQGNPDNIQFLSRDEHYLLAHQGNLRTPVNGYYNLEEGQTEPFTEDELRSCQVISLSHPIFQWQTEHTRYQGNDGVSFESQMIEEQNISDSFFLAE